MRKVINFTNKWTALKYYNKIEGRNKSMFYQGSTWCVEYEIKNF